MLAKNWLKITALRHSIALRQLEQQKELVEELKRGTGIRSHYGSCRGVVARLHATMESHLDRASFPALLSGVLSVIEMSMLSAVLRKAFAFRAVELALRQGRRELGRDRPAGAHHGVRRHTLSSKSIQLPRIASPGRIFRTPVKSRSCLTF